MPSLAPTKLATAFLTLPNYDKNEAEVGQALTDLHVPREKLFVTTKVAEENQGYQPYNYSR